MKRPAFTTSVGLAHLWGEFSSRENAFNLFVALLIGVIGGYGAVGFRSLVGLVGQFVFGSADPSSAALHALPWWARLAIPTVGGLLVGPIVHFFAREAKGHGVPEVMLAVARRGGLIKGRVAAAKVVASAITIGTGGSAGSEGPIVQIGAGLASKLGQLLHVSARRMKTYVGCGGAAGIAATFNAPVAGMIFAVEILLGDFGVAQLSPIIVSSVIATAISRRYLGDAPAFAVPGYEFVSSAELLPYAVLGVAAAAIAVVFIRSLTYAEDRFEAMAIPGWLKPALGGLGVGLLGAVGLPQVFGVGYELIEEALHGQLGVWLMLGLIGAKILATVLTLGSGGSGGILAPCLFLGAMLGGAVWHASHALAPGLVAGSSGAYSLVGMAAVLAAATRAPLQAILILFELTGGYEVILPLMLSSIVAVMLGGRLLSESIYTIKLKARGVDLKAGTDHNVLGGIHVREVMRLETKTVSAAARVRDLLEQLSGSPQHASWFVVDGDGRLQGVVGYPEIRQVLFDVETLASVLRVEDIANADHAPITPRDQLDFVIREFSRMNTDELPVTEPGDPTRIVGSVHRLDVVDAYHAEILKRDLSGGLERSMDAAGRSGTSSIAPGMTMAEVEIPAHFAGHSLAQLNLRRRFGVEVLLIKREIHEEGRWSTEQLMPGPDLLLQAGDKLLVSGKDSDVEIFRGA